MSRVQKIELLKGYTFINARTCEILKKFKFSEKTKGSKNGFPGIMRERGMFRSNATFTIFSNEKRFAPGTWKVSIEQKLLLTQENSDIYFNIFISEILENEMNPIITINPKEFINMFSLAVSSGNCITNGKPEAFFSSLLTASEWT